MTAPQGAQAQQYAPWDQYPGESGGDYQLFGYYRDLGGLRTIRLVERAYAPAYGYGYLVQCAHGWAWKERADAFDLWMAQERDANMAKLRAEHGERWAKDQIEIAEVTTSLVKGELYSLLKRQAQGETIPGNVLARLIEVLHKNQNLALGKPTEILDAGLDLGDASAETLARLESVRADLEKLAKGA